MYLVLSLLYQEGTVVFLYHGADLKDHKLVRLQNLFNGGTEAVSNNFAFYLGVENTSQVLFECHYDFHSRAPELVILCGILAAQDVFFQNRKIKFIYCLALCSLLQKHPKVMFSSFS